MGAFPWFGANESPDFWESFFSFDFADILLAEKLTFAKSQLFGQLFGRKFKAKS